jgi:hypothetical protein
MLGGMIFGKITSPSPIKDRQKIRNVQIRGVFSSLFLRLLSSKPISKSPKRGIRAKI